MCTSGCQKLHNTLHPAGEEPVLPLREGGGLPGGDRAQRGWMGLPVPTLEGGYLPYTGQLMVHDHWGLPELQVGLPGDKKRSKTKGGDSAQSGRAQPLSRATLAFSISTYCAPAASRRLRPREGEGLAQGLTVCLPKG